ncbi:unnamed protein product [Notodromas monacha]|uniref:Uncharacterized protein n=1 Tax=Notodromas monacha TaxID=399045 RepID=A0A7R9BXB9_9CRUS|nr:unnamed protein product [Notodromas monacha]CAG0922347.1 unnamed protein product [Notodromas monacha]
MFAWGPLLKLPAKCAQGCVAFVREDPSSFFDRRSQRFERIILFLLDRFNDWRPARWIRQGSRDERFDDKHSIRRKNHPEIPHHKATPPRKVFWHHPRECRVFPRTLQRKFVTAYDDDLNSRRQCRDRGVRYSTAVSHSSLTPVRFLFGFANDCCTTSGD